MAELIPPRRDETLTTSGIPTLRFSEYLERLAQDVNDVVNETNEALFSEASSLNSKISKLESRINDLEMSDDTDVLNSRIAQVSAKVTRLIEELLEEVKKIRDVELENKALCIQAEALKQLKLLNLRTEEAFETDLNEDDL